MKIKVYIYTAWNGYGWQGCSADTATAVDLRRYLEATGTMPKSSGDTPPFGGAIACQINGTMGCALYTYLVRERGDVFGRDSLYVAFAFIPWDPESGFKVDFGKLLADKVMRKPISGEIKAPCEIDVSDYELKAGGMEESQPWWDRSRKQEKVSGDDALQKLSVFFQSEKTQLGFLRAVIHKDSDSHLIPVIDYQVFNEVAEVVQSFSEYQEKKKLNQGILSKSDRVVVKFRESLSQLQHEKAEKLPQYKGLMQYIKEMESRLSDNEEQLNGLRRLDNRLRDANNNLQHLTISDQGDGWRGSVAQAKRQLGEALKLVDSCFGQPVLGHPYYADMMRSAGELLQTIAHKQTLCQAIEQSVSFFLDTGSGWRRGEFLCPGFSEWAQRQLENRQRDLREQLADKGHEVSQLKVDLTREQSAVKGLQREKSEQSRQNTELVAKNQQLKEELEEYKKKVKQLESSRDQRDGGESQLDLFSGYMGRDEKVNTPDRRGARPLGANVLTQRSSKPWDSDLSSLPWGKLALWVVGGILVLIVLFQFFGSRDKTKTSSSTGKEEQGPKMAELSNPLGEQTEDTNKLEKTQKEDVKPSNKENGSSDDKNKKGNDGKTDVGKSAKKGKS